MTENDDTQRLRDDLAELALAHLNLATAFLHLSGEVDRLKAQVTLSKRAAPQMTAPAIALVEHAKAIVLRFVPPEDSGDAG